MPPDCSRRARMIGRQIELVRNTLNDRNGKRVGKLRQRSVCLRSRPLLDVTMTGRSASPTSRCDLRDGRRSGCDATAPNERSLLRRGTAGRPTLRAGGSDRPPARLAHRMSSGGRRPTRPVGHAATHSPIDELAHHAALVIGSWPHDVAVAGRDMAHLRDRRASGSRRTEYCRARHS